MEGQLLHQYIFSLIAQSKEITWYHPDLLFMAYVLIYNNGYSLLTLQMLYQCGQLWIEPLLHYTLEIWQDGLYLGENTLTRCPDLLLLYEDRPWEIYEFKSKKNYHNSAQLAFTQLPFRLQHRPIEYTLITPNTVQSLDKPLYTSYLALFIKSGVRLFRLNPYTLFRNIYVGNLLALSTISMVAQRISLNIAAIGQPMISLRFWNLLFILFEKILIDFLCHKLLLFPRVNHPHYLAITQEWSRLFTHLEREFSYYLQQHLANYVPLFYSYHKEPNKLFKQSYLYKILMPFQNLQLAWDSQWIANKLILK